MVLTILICMYVVWACIGLMAWLFEDRIEAICTINILLIIFLIAVPLIPWVCHWVGLF